MSLFLPLLLQAAASTGTVLEPVGNWTVAYEDSMCLATRQFGPGGEYKVTFRPSPLSDVLEISVEVPKGHWPSVYMAKASLQIQPSSHLFDGKYISTQMGPHVGQVIVVFTKQGALQELTDGSVLRIATGQNGSISIQPKGIAKVRNVLADCRNVLLKHWGVDLGVLAKVAVPAKPASEEADWLTQNDYPASALARRQSGVTNILWDVGTDGKVANCRVVASSGVPALDEAACRAITNRGRYEPARDAAGQPVVSYQNRRVFWRTF